MVDHAGPTSADAHLDVVIVADGATVGRLRSVIRHLCVGLIDLNARVRLVTSRDQSSSFESLGPVEVLVYDETIRLLRRRRMDKLVQSLSVKHPSVIYAISSGAYELAAHAAAVLEVDLVLGVTASRDVAALDPLSLDRVGSFIAASEPLHEMMLQRRDIPESRIHLIRPGVLRGTGPTCFGDAEAVPALSCTASFDSANSVDLVIEAGTLVRKRGYSLMTFLLGEGPREGAFRKLVRDLNQSAHVVFARPTADMIEVLRGSDMYVLPPGEDEISARPLQAMTSGTAVICFSGGVYDCFHDAQTAFVCREHTPEALAQTIERLLLDHELARAVAASANEYVRKHHQMSAMAEQTHNALQQLTLPGRTFKLNQ